MRGFRGLNLQLVDDARYSLDSFRQALGPFFLVRFRDLAAQSDGAVANFDVDATAFYDAILGEFPEDVVVNLIVGSLLRRERGLAHDGGKRQNQG
jgi:hypothetical protein